MCACLHAWVKKCFWSTSCLRCKSKNSLEIPGSTRFPAGKRITIRNIFFIFASNCNDLLKFVSSGVWKTCPDNNRLLSFTKINFWINRYGVQSTCAKANRNVQPPKLIQNCKGLVIAAWAWKMRPVPEAMLDSKEPAPGLKIIKRQKKKVNQTDQTYRPCSICFGGNDCVEQHESLDKQLWSTKEWCRFGIERPRRFLQRFAMFSWSKAFWQPCILRIFHVRASVRSPLAIGEILGDEECHTNTCTHTRKHMCFVVTTLEIHGGVMAEANKNQKRAGAQASTRG